MATIDNFNEYELNFIRDRIPGYAAEEDEEKRKNLLRAYVAEHGDALRRELDGTENKLKDELTQDLADLAAEYQNLPDKAERNRRLNAITRKAYAYLNANTDLKPSEQYNVYCATIGKSMDETQGSDIPALQNAELSKDLLESIKENRPSSDTARESQTTDLNSMASETGYRVRSSNSDSNEYLMDLMKLHVLHEMEIIDEKVFQGGQKTPTEAIEILNEKLPLNDKQQTEFESRMTEKMLDSEQLFAMMPPKVLAEQYAKAQDQLSDAKKQAPEDDHSEKEAQIAKLEARIDELTDNLVSKNDVFFVDITNISDTYEGYMQMFDAREKTLTDTPENASIKARIADGRNIMNEHIGQYDETWNLQNATADNANDLNRRFDELSENLEKTTLDNETLQLVSNFKFLNAEGQIEPQFVDKDGNAAEAWSEGAQIAKGSKLENMVRIARQNVLMQQLGSDEKPDVEKLNAELKDHLPYVLYAAHVANLVEQGVKEDVNQFTDKAKINQFMRDLADIEKPMLISPTAYDAAVDNCINGVGGYAHRLGAKIGRDNPAVLKVFEPLKDLDKRAADRVSGKPSKRKVRIENLKRLAKTGISAFMVSGAITIAGTAAATDASLTAATGGMNKLAGMAVGSALAVGLTCRQIYRWRKEQKKAGKPAGLKALVTDRRMLMTVGTTALGAAALGFAATGNPGAAQMCGYGALALGSANGVINTYQDSRKAGLNKLESALWGFAQAGMAVGAGFGGRAAANAGIDWYNQQNPDNDIFQHVEKIGEHVETSTTTTQEIVYKDGVIEHAQDILKSWYNENPDLLQQRVDAINAYNAEHGTNINPYRYLLASHDAGALTADNNLLHVQDGADVHTHANHTVLGQGWSDATGISQDVVKTLAGSVNGADVNLTPESIAAFQQIDTHISGINQVGYAAGAPYQNDGVLGYNAETDANGTMVHSESGDRYTTYANHDGPMEIKEHTIVHETIVEDYGNVRNETDLGVGMFGVLGRRFGGKLKDRIGSLADRLFKRQPAPEVKQVPTPVPPSKPIEKPVPPSVQNKEPVQDQVSTPAPSPEPTVLLPQYTEMTLQKMLDKEYRIVHGIEPNDNERKRYRALVQQEMAADALGTTNLGDYLGKRMDNFEKIIQTTVAPLDESRGFADTEKGRKHINESRELMWKTNLKANGQKLESKDVTLLHFGKLAGIGRNSDEFVDVRAAEDRRRTPPRRDKGDRPHGKSIDLTVFAKSKQGR